MDGTQENATNEEEPVMTETREENEVTVETHEVTQTPPEEGARQVVAVGAVRVELPTCDVTDIDTWLLMCENLMADAGVTVPATKFRKILSKLPPQQFRTVKHLIQHPLPPNCYERLKECLRKRLQLTPSERLRKLENLPLTLGDGRPSDLFYQLESLYPNDTNQEIVKESFFKRLPAALQMLCREWARQMPLSEVALRADEVYTPALGPPIAPLSHAIDIQPTSGNVTDQLPCPETCTCSGIRTFRQPGGGPRGARAGRGRGRGRGRGHYYIDRWCRLHQRYGPQARNCLGSCTYLQDTSTSSGNGPSNR